MSDYISREEMLDAVDHLRIIPSIGGTGKPTPTEDFRVQFLGTVLKVKPADVAPVVRCEDCVHWSDSNQCARPELAGNRWHDAKYFETLPDDFCSYGEREE